MTKSQRDEELSFIAASINLVRGWVSYYQDLYEMASLELQLARRTLVLISLLAIAILFFFMIFWVFLMSSLAAWLVTLHLSWPVALLFVAAFHALLIAVAILIIFRVRNYLTFPKTRRQFRRKKNAYHQKD